MNIADILNPRIPTIDAARVTAHQLPDDGGETKCAAKGAAQA